MVASHEAVDMIALRKDHSEPIVGAKRGDALQIILIQIKGGNAAKPTKEDGKRLMIVAKRHNACGILLATWKKGSAARFFALQRNQNWIEINDLKLVFG
jgi:hypothetical protein